ncbi:MAG TPA: hypothetical protein VFH61_05355 [Thermoleophilia bacterium]|nr:hypothetical protein [Thermoleophilia bacterium]
MEAQDIRTLSEEAHADVSEVGKLLGLEASFAKKKFSTETVDAFVGLLNEALDGNAKAHYLLKEAAVVADFPLLFADVLDRSVMAQWATSIPAWQSYTKIGSMRDFRGSKTLGIEGMGAILDEVGERAEYPERAPSEETPITRQIKKYGARFGISFETVINDDLGLLRDLPQKLVVAARRSEALAVSKLYVGTAGFNTAVYNDATYDNIVNQHAGAAANNPPLSIAGLSDAFTVLGNHTDIDGFPLIIDAVTLVVPTALEVAAMNIMNATTLRVATGGGAYDEVNQLDVRNWMNGRLNVVVDPYIGMTATSNAATTWFLFASTSAARPAIQLDYLAGHETPELFSKVPDAARVGGGTVPESFHTDEQQFKVRHIYGTTVIDPRATVASNGTGS